ARALRGRVRGMPGWLVEGRRRSGAPATLRIVAQSNRPRGRMGLMLRALSMGATWCVGAFLSCGAGAQSYVDVDSFAAPTNATMMIYSSTMGALVLKNSGSAIVAIDIASRQPTTRLANSLFTDISLSPSGRYVFAADYGGENIGYGTPRGTSYVHRLDLTNMSWDLRTAYIAGNVQ